MSTATVPTVEGRKLSLSHFGLSCFDLAPMEDFYTRVLGMTVTDRGVVDSPWYVHQPCGEYLDVSLDDSEILRQTEELCRAAGGCEPVETWREKLARRIAAAQACLR